MGTDPAAVGPAPWRAAFLSHITTEPATVEFVLSTLHRAPADSLTPYVPRARYCIFRGMWGELPPNAHNTAPRNESVYQSDLPTFTTDIRMGKIEDLFGGGEASHGEVGSGGGGPVEAVWWVKGVMKQWRVKGNAFVVGPDTERDGGETTEVRAVKKELMPRMRVVQPGNEESWSWAKEVTAHFGNLSPAMRGTFMQPPPGKPVHESYDENKYAMGEKVEDVEHQVARHNFRVVVIRPDEVEQLDLEHPEKARRLRYTWKAGEWIEEETWP